MKGWTWLLLVPLLVAGAFYGHDLLLGLHRPYGPGAPSPKWPELGTPWAMWPVDNPGDWLPNGLDLADVNGDGFPDLLVNYEFRGRIRVVLHPGPDLTRDRFWPAIDVGTSPTPKARRLGTSMGMEPWTSSSSRGSSTTATRPRCGSSGGEGEPSVAGRGPLPASLGLGQYLDVQAADVDGDGFLDIVVGGRAARLAGGRRTAQALEGLVRTGLRWFRNPRGDGRDPGTWGPGPSSPSTPRSQAATGSS